MTMREKPEDALAQAEAARKSIEIRLVEAKAVLVKMATDGTTLDASWAEAEAKVEKARARCRQLRAALADPNNQEFITRSRQRIDAMVEHSDDLSKGESIAKPRPVQPRRQAHPSKNEGAFVEPLRRKPFTRFGDALAASVHVREAISLLALVLAYLQYYFLDVQLQIVSLPSVTTLPVH